MKYRDLFKIIRELDFDKNRTIFKDSNLEIWVLRPSKLSKRFSGYDANKNFQIWLKEGGRSFRPNHLRCMIDLNLRVRSRPDLKQKLLVLFDKIFSKKDFDKELIDLQKEKFEHYLNSLEVICILYQLFLIEQEYCYHKESKFDPPNLFLHGWIREFIDSPKEIDNMCMGVCSGQPPIARYTVKDNKKNKKYDGNAGDLWYLEN